MLRNIDVDKIFSVSRTLGYSQCEIFAEVSFETAMNIQARQEKTQTNTIAGIAIRCFSGKKSRLVFTGQFQTKAILELLTQGRAGGNALPTPTHLPTKFRQRIMAICKPQSQKTGLLSRLARNTWAYSSEIRNPLFEYRDKIRFFSVVKNDTPLINAVEESASVNVSWTIQQYGNWPIFRGTVCRNSIDALCSDLQNKNPFHGMIQRSLDLANPWPAPRGEMPVLWSSLALSKLILKFLRSFEGDVVLDNASFLTNVALPLDLNFSLQDKPDVQKLPYDNEGSPRRAMVFLHQGKPKGLACDYRTAEQMNVPSTGHCRRESFQNTPTVGFWSPELITKNTTDNLVKGIKGGLSVGDVEVHRHHPSESHISLKLKSLSLIHHGEIGEAVEPVDLEIDLLQLLGTLKTFSTHKEIHGLICDKGRQNFITELATPEALSEALQIPGRVPMSHYW